MLSEHDAYHNFPQSMAPSTDVLELVYL